MDWGAESEAINQQMEFLIGGSTPAPITTAPPQGAGAGMSTPLPASLAEGLAGAGIEWCDSRSPA